MDDLGSLCDGVAPEADQRIHERKVLRLRTAVTLGSRFGEWEVCWLGNWTRHRLWYLVMVVRVVRESANSASLRGASRRADGIAMVNQLSTCAGKHV